MPGRISYIMSRFPHLPETFILREMIALEELGWKIELYPLILQHQDVIHAEALPWVKRAHPVPWFSLGLLTANIQSFLSRPKKYFSLWWQIFRENLGSPKFLVRALLLFPRAVWMAREFKTQGIVHIHAHYASHPALVAWLIHQLTGIPYSVTVHAHDIFVEKPMLATKLHDAAFVSSISEYNRDYLVRELGPWIGDKTRIIRCGIDPSFYEAAKIESNSNRLEIISVGSLQPYKGFIFLVQSCAILRDHRIPYHCRIVGGGDLRLELERSIQQYQLEDAVELVGPRTQDEVSRLLRSANCYVQPSIVMTSGKMEGIPVALMEAMASGIPVVASSISGIPELVREGETGWLVPPEDSASLADVILRIHAEPTEACRRAKNGKRLVINEFELSSNVSKLAALFTQANVPRPV
jgi:colanic acid/amylovoran biosynthesis glycosyltransferase